MLVLSRKKNEGIRIGDDIRLVVVEIRGDKVRLGFEAPQAVPIHRDEIWLAIHKQQDAQQDVQQPEPTEPQVKESP